MSTPATNTTFQGTSRFQVLGPLGVGAMCVVHRARDRELGDVVALKTLKHLDSDSLYRLKQEFRALSAFDHPNLVSFYELLQSGDGWFVTMEMIEGVDFLSWCRGEEEGDLSRARTMNTFRTATDLRFGRSAPGGKALDEDNAVTEVIEALPEMRLPDMLHLRSALRQLADGVAALHAGGRIHRDLKPGNVLVSDAGRVVILDFGLVADIDQDYTEGTLHQSIAGSAAYMSPEQAIGSPLTAAADWYAVGVMLYEGLTGRWPFTGSLYQILTQKNAMDPPSPADLLGNVPSDLNDLCMALLQRDPEARPTGGEVLATLRSHEPGKATAKLMVPFRYRDDELATLRAARAHAQQGRPAVVLVRGPSGSGRTQLVREFVKEANKSGLTTLKGRCYEWENVDYKALDGLIDNMARALRRAPLEIVRALSNEDLSWLAALFPVMARADALDVLPADAEGVPRDQVVARGFAQLGTVFDALSADKPLLLFIDDAHWGDVDSARALARLLTERPDRKLLLVLTAAADATGPFLNFLAPRLAESAVGTATIDLGPLDLRATAQLAAAMLGEPADAPDVLALAQASGGMPGALRELVRQRVTSSSQDEQVLDEVRMADIAGLPLAPRRLLELLAIAGGPVPTEVAIVAANLGDQAVNAVSTLRAHRVADVSGATAEALEVGSRTVMDHVLDTTPESVRQLHHRALADALEKAGAPDPLVLATHYAGAGDGQRAGTVAWLAANRALEAGQWAQAVPLLDVALEHGEWPSRERVGILATLARTHGLLGEHADAADVLARALAIAPERSQPALQRQQADHWLALGDQVRGEPLIAYLRDSAGLPGFATGGLVGGGMAAWRRFQQRRRGDAFDTKLRTDVDAEQLHKVDVAFSCVSALGLNDPEKAWDYQSTHLTTALDVGEVERVMRAQCEEVVLAVARDAGADTELLTRVEELAAKHRSAMGEAYLLAAQARIGWLRGDVVTTTERGGAAAQRLRRTARPAWQREPIRTAVLHARILSSEVGRATQDVDSLARRARHHRDPRALVHLLGRVGPYVAAAGGRGPGLRKALGSALDAIQGPLPGGWGVLGLAHIDLLDGQHAAALERLGAVEARVQSAFVDPWLRTAWARAKGLAARGAGDGREAARQAAALRKDDRAWASAWADLIEQNYGAAGARLRDLGWSLEQAAAVANTDGGAKGPSAQWLRGQGVGDVEGLCRAFT